jgi:hypothetical protein
MHAVATVRRTLLALIVGAFSMASGLAAQALADVECVSPPPAHCGESCAPALFAERGNAVDPGTGRAFFLDFPCDLQPGEDVTFILSIHGAGAIGNWHRHYFPALDYMDKYRLVIATPTAEGSGSIGGGGGGTRMWVADQDDQHLQNIVNLVVERFGRENIKSFWLAGHSQGGMTSNRIVCTPFFRDKVDGWLSLSGGRIGRAEIAPGFFGDGQRPPTPPPSSSGAAAPQPGAAVTPPCDISFIFASGQLEIVDLPTTSPEAEKYHCGARVQQPDIVDEVRGYVTGAAPGRGPAWGLEARPGTTEEWIYPNCDGGRVVADFLRLDKGHTEGLEPRVTEAIVRMMVSAPGGKLQRMGG